MSDGSAGGRRYDDDEVARILKRATEIRSESTAVSRSRPQEGLSLRDLEEIAAEAGIDVAHMRQAALELETRADPDGWGERYVGGPWTLVREATIEGELSEDGFQAMVAAVQTALTEPGFPSLVGRTMSWKNEAQKAGGRSTMVMVTSRGGSTTIRIEENLQQVAGGFHGGITAGGGVGIGVGLGVPVAVAQGSLLLGLGIPAACIALGWAVARTSYRAYLRRRGRAVAALLARLVNVAEAEARPPEDRLPSGG